MAAGNVLRPCRFRTHSAETIVGSKRFTESYILGEIARQTLQAAGRPRCTARASGTPPSSSSALASGAVHL